MCCCFPAFSLCISVREDLLICLQALILFLAVSRQLMNPSKMFLIPVVMFSTCGISFWFFLEFSSLLTWPLSSGVLSTFSITLHTYHSQGFQILCLRIPNSVLYLIPVLMLRHQFVSSDSILFLFGFVFVLPKVKNCVIFCPKLAVLGKWDEKAFHEVFRLIRVGSGCVECSLYTPARGFPSPARAPALGFLSTSSQEERAPSWSSFGGGLLLGAVTSCTEAVGTSRGSLFLLPDSCGNPVWIFIPRSWWAWGTWRP